MNGIIVDNEGNLIISVQKDKNGLITQGLTIGASDDQNAQLLILAEKGEFKHAPILGVGVRKYIHSVGKERELIRETKVQLGLIGYPDAEVRLTKNKELEVNV